MKEKSEVLLKKARKNKTLEKDKKDGLVEIKYEIPDLFKSVFCQIHKQVSILFLI